MLQTSRMRNFYQNLHATFYRNSSVSKNKPLRNQCKSSNCVAAEKTCTTNIEVVLVGVPCLSGKFQLSFIYILSLKKPLAIEIPKQPLEFPMIFNMAGTAQIAWLYMARKYFPTIQSYFIDENSKSEHVPAIVSFSHLIKRWQLVTASRHRARSGLIPDNDLPALRSAAFIVLSGRCLNSLFIIYMSQKLMINDITLLPKGAFLYSI